MIDWTLIIDDAIKETIRLLPSIALTISGIVLPTWRQNLKTRKVVADGLKELALEAGKARGFEAAIPLAREDRREMLETAKELANLPRKE